MRPSVVPCSSLFAVLLVTMGCDDATKTDPPPLGHDGGRDGGDASDSDDASDARDARDSSRDSARDTSSDTAEECAGDATSDADEEGGTDAGPTCADPEGPLVEFLSPEAGVDPNTDPFLSDPVVLVRCDITPPNTATALPVDSDSVRILRLNQAGGVMEEGTVTLAGAGVYRATFDLTGLDNSHVYFRCEASDVADSPRCNSAEQTSILDLGPEVTVTSPEDGAIHGDTMSVTFMITALPIDESVDDTLAVLATQTLVAAGAVIPDVAEYLPGSFAADVDFGDTTVFPTSLSGTYQLRVTATNERGATREETVEFTVDADGPTVTITNPASDGILVGGLTTVNASASDPAGIGSVTITSGGASHPMESIGGNFYRYTLDTAIFPSTVTETLINVTATDSVGNVRTAARTVKLDSVPPIVDLDPPEVRETYRIGSYAGMCSERFDPVGWDSVNDGEVAGSAAEFRIRTHDLGNSSEGGSGTVTFLAGVDSASARLMILDDTTVPLIVDGDGDGVCDSVNPDVLPGPGVDPAAVQWTLAAVTPAGGFDGAEIDLTSHDDPLVAAIYEDYCHNPSTLDLGLICDSTTLWRVIASPVAGEIATIYAKPPIGGATCVGDALDFQTSLAPGWACVVAAVDDNLGNTGISAPLRVCFTADPLHDWAPCGAAPGYPADDPDIPDCTDGCSQPPGFADNPGSQLILLN